MKKELALVWVVVSIFVTTTVTGQVKQPTSAFDPDKIGKSFTNSIGSRFIPLRYPGRSIWAFLR